MRAGFAAEIGLPVLHGRSWSCLSPRSWDPSMNTRLALFAGLIGLSLTGCGGHEVVRPTVDVSIGQQLIDLKRAREAGAPRPASTSASANA